MHQFAATHHSPQGRPYRLRVALDLADPYVVGTHAYRLTEQDAAAWHQHVVDAIEAGGIICLVDDDDDLIGVSASRITMVMVKAMAEDQDQDQDAEGTFPLVGRAAFLDGLDQTRKT